MLVGTTIASTNGHCAVSFCCSCIEEYMSEDVTHVVSCDNWDENFDQVKERKSDWSLLILFFVCFLCRPWQRMINWSLSDLRGCLCVTALELCCRTNPTRSQNNFIFVFVPLRRTR